MSWDDECALMARDIADVLGVSVTLTRTVLSGAITPATGVAATLDQRSQSIAAVRWERREERVSLGAGQEEVVIVRPYAINLDDLTIGPQGAGGLYIDVAATTRWTLTDGGKAGEIVQIDERASNDHAVVVLVRTERR